MRRYSAKETCNLIDPTNRSHPISIYTVHAFINSEDAYIHSAHAYIYSVHAYIIFCVYQEYIYHLTLSGLFFSLKIKKYTRKVNKYICADIIYSVYEECTCCLTLSGLLSLSPYSFRSSFFAED